MPCFHSEVYPDGRVCISILHTPGDDPTHYEQASERWSPVQSVEKVILSVISLLAGTALPSYLRFISADVDRFFFRRIFFPPDICFYIPTGYFAEPNLESGANIDCCKLYRENKEVSADLPMVKRTHISPLFCSSQEYIRLVKQQIRAQLGL